MDLEREKLLSGYSTMTGITISEISKRRAVVSFIVNDNLKNLHGTVHGGAIFTLMDVAAGISGTYGEKNIRNLVTQSANIHFIRPVVSGCITAESETIHEGEKTGLAVVNVYDEARNILATGMFNLFYLE